jgi:hypothetical protein
MGGRCCGQCNAPGYGDHEAINGVAAAPSPQSVITHTIDGSARIGANDHSDMIVIQVTEIRRGGRPVTRRSIRRRAHPTDGAVTILSARLRGVWCRVAASILGRRGVRAEG